MKTIPLTQGQVALVDEADYEAVSQFKWQASKCGRGFHAVRTMRTPDGKRVSQYLHQFLMPGVDRIDHRDGNGCNDQMENLRPATHHQNMQGFQRKRLNAKSKYRGVSWHKQTGKWQAGIRFYRKAIYLGLFSDEKDAARVYNEAALKYFGDTAHLNIIT